MANNKLHQKLLDEATEEYKRKGGSSVNDLFMSKLCETLQDALDRLEELGGPKPKRKKKA